MKGSGACLILFEVKAEEYALSKEHNEQLMQLQQRSQARRAQLEQQATNLVLEFQQRHLDNALTSLSFA